MVSSLHFSQLKFLMHFSFLPKGCELHLRRSYGFLFSVLLLQKYNMYKLAVLLKSYVCDHSLLCILCISVVDIVRSCCVAGSRNTDLLLTGTCFWWPYCFLILQPCEQQLLPGCHHGLPYKLLHIHVCWHCCLLCHR